MTFLRAFSFRAHTHPLLLLAMFLVVGCSSPEPGQEAPGASLPDPGEATHRAALEQNPDDVDVRMQLVTALRERKAHRKALAVLEEGLELTPDNTRILWGLAETATAMAWDFERPDPMTKAARIERRNLFEQAAKRWDKLAKMGVRDGEPYRQIAFARRELKHYPKAIDAALTALEFRPEDPFFESELAYFYLMSGKYEKAQRMLLELSKRVPGNYLVWWRLADTQRLLGNYESSITSFEKAFSVCPEAKRAGVAEALEFTRKLNAKRPSQGAYSAHKWLALRHAMQGRPGRKAAEDRAGLVVLPPNKPLQEGNYHLDLARFLGHVGERQEALEHCTESIRCYTEAGNHTMLSRAYDVLATTYVRPDRSQESLFNEYRKNMLAARERQEHHAKEAGDGHAARHALADRTKSMEEFFGLDDERVVPLRREMVALLPAEGPLNPMQCDLASIMYKEAIFRVKEEDYEGARILFKRALPNFLHPRSKKPGTVHMGPATCEDIAHACEMLGEYDEAITYGEKAAKLFSAMRSKFGVDEFRRKVGQQIWREVYAEGLVQFALAKEDPAAVFNYAERYKGRSLLDLLGTKPLESSRETVAQERRQERVALARVRSLEQDISQARVAEEGATLRSLERTLSIERTDYERLKEDLDAATIAVQSFENVAAIEVDEVQQLARDHAFTFVSYVISERGLIVTVVSANDVHAVLVEEATPTVIHETLEACQQGLGIRSPASRDLALESPLGAEPAEQPGAEEAFEKSLQWLYDTLVAPIHPHLKTPLIYISRDEWLNYVPFEAIKNNGRFLVEDFTIAYAPSASVLKFCLEKERHRKESVLALGNPNLRNPAFRLVNAENEVHTLEGLFPKVDVYTSDDATENVVRERAGDYDILHFACHGELNIDEPMLTALRLAPDDENDGYLHAGELFEYDLSASLVVLSACNTALGELTTGNELMGLTRGFFSAGTPAVVASLWTVDDRSTSHLMQGFYRNMATMTKADALRQAKLATMKEYPSPFHWAAFCLQGDYR